MPKRCHSPYVEYIERIALLVNYLAFCFDHQIYKTLTNILGYYACAIMMMHLIVRSCVCVVRGRALIYSNVISDPILRVRLISMHLCRCFIVHSPQLGWLLSKSKSRIHLNRKFLQMETNSKQLTKSKNTLTRIALCRLVRATHVWTVN